MSYISHTKAQKHVRTYQVSSMFIGMPDATAKMNKKMNINESMNKNRNVNITQIQQISLALSLAIL